MNINYFCIYLVIPFVLSDGVTVDDINQLRIELRDEFDANMETTVFGVRFRSLLATTVRLTFHDCSGPGEAGSTEIAQCNGCIDFQNDDHAGLQSTVEQLQTIYNSGWNNLMSRADFWSAAGIIIIIFHVHLHIH